MKPSDLHAGAPHHNRKYLQNLGSGAYFQEYKEPIAAAVRLVITCSMTLCPLHRLTGIASLPEGSKVAGLVGFSSLGEFLVSDHCLCFIAWSEHRESV